MPKEKILKSFAIIARVILQKSADVKKNVLVEDEV